MSSYIPIPVETDPSDIAREAFEYLEEHVPGFGWDPAAGNLESWLIEALAAFGSELRSLVSLVPTAIFTYLGETVLGVPAHQATQASAMTRWRAIDDAGYTVDAGTQIAVFPPAATESFAFSVVQTFTIPEGGREASGIEVLAVEEGSAASGLTGSVQTIDQLDFIESVELEGPTSGGEDAEPTEDYLSRLQSYLQLLAPRPILPADFAQLVRVMVPGVGRATAIDLYNADTGETNVPRCVTVAITDADGEPVSSEIKQQAAELLRSEREVNFLSFVIDARDYKAVDVRFEASSLSGFIPSEVAGRVVENFQRYLSPAAWGRPNVGDPGSGTPGWLNVRVVRWLELGQVVNDTDGVDYIISLESRLAGGSWGTVDLVLPGPAPLTRPGDISGTCVPTSSG